MVSSVLLLPVEYHHTISLSSLVAQTPHREVYGSGLCQPDLANCHRKLAHFGLKLAVSGSPRQKCTVLVHLLQYVICRIELLFSISW